MYTSTKRHLVSNENCFELYGFDILLDSKLKPWILEVNLAPSLATGSNLDFDVKMNLIKDLLNLVGLYPKIKK